MEATERTRLPRPASRKFNFSKSLTTILLLAACCLGGTTLLTSCNEEYDDTALTTITLPKTLKSIWNDVFSYCYDLTTVTCLATEPPTLGDFAFAGCPLEAIYVPDSSVDAYKAAANWIQHENIIQAK